MPAPGIVVQWRTSKNRSPNRHSTNASSRGKSATAVGLVRPPRRAAKHDPAPLSQGLRGRRPSRPAHQRLTAHRRPTSTRPSTVPYAPRRQRYTHPPIFRHRTLDRPARPANRWALVPVPYPGCPLVPVGCLVANAFARAVPHSREPPQGAAATRRCRSHPAGRPVRAHRWRRRGLHTLALVLTCGALSRYIAGSAFRPQNVLGLTVDQASVAFLLGALTATRSSTANTKLAGRYPPRLLLRIGLATMPAAITAALLISLARQPAQPGLRSRAHRDRLPRHRPGFRHRPRRSPLSGSRTRPEPARPYSEPCRASSAVAPHRSSAWAARTPPSRFSPAWPTAP